MEFIAQELDISGGEHVLDVRLGQSTVVLAQRFSCRGWGNACAEAG